MQTTITAPRGVFEPGDVVELVSGGPEMTVVDRCQDCGEVEVAFFLFGEDASCTFHRELFPAIALELAQ